jgi:hypothetical protein
VKIKKPNVKADSGDTGWFTVIEFR